MHNKLTQSMFLNGSEISKTNPMQLVCRVIDYARQLRQKTPKDIQLMCILENRCYSPMTVLV